MPREYDRTVHLHLFGKKSDLKNSLFYIYFHGMRRLLRGSDSLDLDFDLPAMLAPFYISTNESWRTWTQDLYKILGPITSKSRLCIYAHAGVGNSYLTSDVVKDATNQPADYGFHYNFFAKLIATFCEHPSLREPKSIDDYRDNVFRISIIGCRAGLYSSEQPSFPALLHYTLRKRYEIFCEIAARTHKVFNYPFIPHTNILPITNHRKDLGIKVVYRWNGNKQIVCDALSDRVEGLEDSVQFKVNLVKEYLISYISILLKDSQEPINFINTSNLGHILANLTKCKTLQEIQAVLNNDVLIYLNTSQDSSASPHTQNDICKNISDLIAGLKRQDIMHFWSTCMLPDKTRQFRDWRNEETGICLNTPEERIEHINPHQRIPEIILPSDNSDSESTSSTGSQGESPRSSSPSPKPKRIPFEDVSIPDINLLKSLLQPQQIDPAVGVNQRPPSPILDSTLTTPGLSERTAPAGFFSGSGVIEVYICQQLEQAPKCNSCNKNFTKTTSDFYRGVREIFFNETTGKINCWICGLVMCTNCIVEFKLEDRLYVNTFYQSIPSSEAIMIQCCRKCYSAMTNLISERKRIFFHATGRQMIAH